MNKTRCREAPRGRSPDGTDGDRLGGYLRLSSEEDLLETGGREDREDGRMARMGKSRPLCVIFHAVLIW